MSVTLLLPGQLRELNHGHEMVELEGAPATVAEALQALRRQVPSAYERVLTEQGQLRPHVNVFVGTEDIRWSGGLATPLREGSEVVILPSVSGGAKDGFSDTVVGRAAARIRADWDSAMVDLPDRSVLESDLATVARAVEEVSHGRPLLAGLSDGLHAARVLAILRKQVLQDWPQGGRLGEGALLELLQAFEAVAAVVDPAESKLAAGLLDPFARRLLREVAHTLRSPFSSVVFLADAMQRGQSGPVTEIQEKQLRIIYRASTLLGQMAGDLLEIAGTGDEVFEEPAAFMIEELVERIAGAVSPICEERMVVLERSTPTGASRLGGRRALQRVLLGLTLNAVLRARDGQVDIRAAPQGPTVVRFTVEGPEGPSESVDRGVFRTEPGREDYSISADALRLASARALLRRMTSELESATLVGGRVAWSFSLDLPAPP